MQSQAVPFPLFQMLPLEGIGPRWVMCAQRTSQGASSPEWKKNRMEKKEGEWERKEEGKR